MQTSVLKAEEIYGLVDAVESSEIVQEVSVAAAYFEDTLERTPEVIVSAGPLGADRLAEMMDSNGLKGLRVAEMVTGAMLEADAASASTPRSWLAGLRGALRG
jgi:type IV pilus assembly protein PilM